MSKRGTSKGTLVFWVGGIVLFIIAGIWKLVTGHAPKDMDWIFWGLIAVSIIIDAEAYLEQIIDNTNEIKEEIRNLQERLDEIESKLDV